MGDDAQIMHAPDEGAFAKHSIEYSIGDYYFHKAENGGNDYVIGVYSKSQRKIYLLEWHQ